MTFSIHVPELQPVIVVQPVRKRLIFAQQRIQDQNLPFHFAALSYLRICCSAMQTYRRLGLTAAPFLDSKTPYLTLLARLLKLEPDWWKLCYVSESGYLISDNPRIQELLQPLSTFAEQILKAP